MISTSPKAASLALYLLVGLVASVLFAFGLLMMKSRFHVLPTAQGPRTLWAIVDWLRDPIWLGGLLVQTLGYALFICSSRWLRLPSHWYPW